VHKLGLVALLALLLALPAFGGGTHVILLIDDSGDMRQWREPLEQKLPSWLFLGPDPSDPGTPRFDPAVDTLSVLYFSLRNEGAPDACKAARGDVITPDTLLQIEPIAATDEETFRRALHESLDRPCRFDGHLSPIATAPIFALPYVRQHLTGDALFSRVLIATVSNEKFNFKGASPSAEMSYLVENVPEYDVQVPAATLDKAREVTSSFNFDTSPRWSAAESDLKYRVVEASGRGRTAEAALVFNRRIQVDRVAAAGDRVLVVPKIAGAGDIHIPRTELVPQSLEWRLGDGEAQGTIDLTQCAPPACTADRSGWRVDLFHPAINPLAQRSADPPFAGSALAFRATFRLDVPQVYSRLSLTSAWQQMSLVPAPPASAWFLAIPVRFDNPMLTRLWFRGDGAPPAHGLTQDEAVTRLARLNFAAWTLTILILVLVIARIARRSRVYTFEPGVEWRPAGEVVLDFQRPGYSRVLAGSLVIRNQGKVGWLGKRLGGVEQPTRTATIALDPAAAERIAQAGFDLRAGVALGFFDHQRVLKTSVHDAVSDGHQIHVFLAEEAIGDFDAAEIEEKVVELAIPVTIEFAPKDVARRANATIRTDVKIGMRVKPETAPAPKVQFERVDEPLHYGADQRLMVGRLRFESRAAHRFARPFSATYALAATCEKRPLAGTPLCVVPDTVVLGTAQEAHAAVELWCGDEEVRNPEPATHHYAFTVHGDHVSEYDPDDLSFALHRDPARSELELYLTYRSKRVEVHWDAARNAWACRPEAGLDVAVEGNVVRFRKPSHFKFEAQETRSIGLGLDIGNSAKSGRGSVSVRVSAKVALARDVEGMLHTRPDWDAHDILDAPLHPLVVREGAAPVAATVVLRSTPIASIDGGEIAPEKCAAHIALAVEITSDGGEVERRSLGIAFPLHLEQLPGANVVVIDFGTSSIAAAVGIAGERNDDPLLDLQHVKVHEDESIATKDPVGSEAGTPFLPSAIVCDADFRQTVTEYGRTVPPGFPRHTGMSGASPVPSAPSFITLPALSIDFRERPGRVLVSLKTWLGMNAQYVPLPAGEMRFRDGARMRTAAALPLDDLLQASYAALAQAYLKAHGPLGAGRVVICHPNTFSESHRDRLRRVAWNALAGPLEILSRKHLHLMSESDAVAYAYCSDRMRETTPRGTERILVYDLGAGTLDLSVITIEWNADPVYPIFRSRHHLGVPVAGNYFDETLARIIHELLSDENVLGTQKLQYVHPVVARATKTVDHAKASRELWNAIRQAKQQWGDEKDFEVVVGDPHGDKNGVVMYAQDLSGPGVPSEVHGRAGVVIRRTDAGAEKLVLVVPREQILSHPRIVRLVEFVGREVVREALAVAGLNAPDVDTLIVSGRGAQWPGLRKRVEAELRNARPVQFASSAMMKAAVARGAIARHYFDADNGIESDAAMRGRLAVVYGQDAGAQAIFEERWGEPIRIPVAKFRIVDVGLSQPDPARDLGNGSLRKHFYVGVGKREYTTQQVGGSVLHFKKVGAGAIVVTNEDGEQHPIGGDDTDHHAAVAWPVGHPFLSPDEEQA